MEIQTRIAGNNGEQPQKKRKNMPPHLSSDDLVDPKTFARSYQLEALEKAIKENTIIYLETGSGKTLIAIMLLRAYAHLIRKPSPFIAVFLVPTVVLVTQQAEAVTMHTDLKVGKYWGDLGVDYWDELTWKAELKKYEVLLMTPRVLLDALRHGFFKLDIIKLLIFDECHNARGRSDYACILKEFYHPCLRSSSTFLPRIFGMTASLVKSKVTWWKAYGCDVPDLTRFAIRVLGLTCTSSGCERNWSTFNNVHTKKRNRLNQSKCNALVYVMFNNRLTLKRKMRQIKVDRHTPGDVALERDGWESDNEWVVDRQEEESVEENEEEPPLVPPPPPRVEDPEPCPLWHYIIETEIDQQAIMAELEEEDNEDGGRKRKRKKGVHATSTPRGGGGSGHAISTPRGGGRSGHAITPTSAPRGGGGIGHATSSRVSSSPDAYKKEIVNLENLLNSKVFTVVNESVLAQYIPFSNTKLKFYEHMDVPFSFLSLRSKLRSLKTSHEQDLKKLNITDSQEDSAKNKISKLWSNFVYCAEELGIWLAYKAAESLSYSEIYFWEAKLGGRDEHIIRKLSKDILKVILEYIPTGPNWRIGDDVDANLESGLMGPKVNCLIESLMEYREIKNLRCIIFVERIITAIVLKSLLSQVLVLSGWNTDYMAGKKSGMQSQSRKEHVDIVDAFRNGTVNIIVATQILEEGLDVQSCNLVIRFDPASTVCSFIQSRGRARKKDSDFVLIVKSGDDLTLSRINNYLASGDIMRAESLCHASFPCAPIKTEMYDEEFYCVETTGAIVTLSSSVALIYYYCSQLPSDGYFRPSPRFIFDEESNICTLCLPKNCPVQMVQVEGGKDILKKRVCLEACKRLHKIGALTDKLLPYAVVEIADARQVEDVPYEEDQMSYFPSELVSNGMSCSNEIYHCYSILVTKNFDYDCTFRNIVLLSKTALEYNVQDLEFQLMLNRGSVTVNLVYSGIIHLSPEQVLVCKKFQITVLRILIDKKLNNLMDDIAGLEQQDSLPRVDYLLLPSIGYDRKDTLVDWDCVRSSQFSSAGFLSDKQDFSPCRCAGNNCIRTVHTKNSVVCRCMLVNSLVFTPHNGHIYCITDILGEMNGNSCISDDDCVTYREYFLSRHGIKLLHDRESLLRGRHIFTVRNWLQRKKCSNDSERSIAWVELPPELCVIIMSPISIDTLYSYSLVPSIMHRVESVLLAFNLKQMISNYSMQNVNVSTIKVLEAITTKRCLEEFSLESLETLGDSFLKYAVGQHLFRSNTCHHEGILSARKDRMICNSTLCRLGCARKLQGFIRHESFDPKNWSIPGDLTRSSALEEVSLFTSRNIYVNGKRCIKNKVVADVVEGLIGAYLISGGERTALIFMDWLGMKIDFFKDVPSEVKLQMHPDRHVDVSELESMLKYSFRDRSLLVEALTHASYQLPDISGCYQRLEFLGDSILDHLITISMYMEYPGVSPGKLTELRSASVNNDCYAQAAVKAGLHKHVLHASLELHRHIQSFVDSTQKLSLGSTFGWETETTAPKVLGDIIESLAGAIFIDSGYHKDIVWKCIRPLLEPLVTPDTVKLHPVMELNELCQKRSFEYNTYTSSSDDGEASLTVEVKADGKSYSHTCTGENKKTAERLAARVVLEALNVDMAE